MQAGTYERPRRQGLTADGSGADQRLHVELTLTGALVNCPRTCIAYTDALSPSVLAHSGTEEERREGWVTGHGLWQSRPSLALLEMRGKMAVD